MNKNTKIESLWSTEFFFLLLLSLSYLYCLPLLRTGVLFGVTASEIRLYDLVFLVVLFLLIIPNVTLIFKRWGNLSMAHKYLLYWIILGLVGLVVTLINRDSRFLIGIIRYFRFFSFAIIFVLGFMYIKNRKQLIFIFDALLLGIIFISIIGSLQAFNLLPNLWPDYYAIYSDFDGGYLSTAFLAPNHTHYSLIMSFGIVMALTRLSISSRPTIMNAVYLVSLLPMLYSMIASRGRSGWLVVGIFIVINLILGRNLRGLILGLLILGGIGIFLNNDIQAGSSSVQDILLYRSINASKQLGRTAFDVIDEDEKNWIERVDDNRWYIYQRSLEFLLNNPKYLFFGAGFQNASQGIGGVALAAHNAYLNVVAEHGLIGLFIYLAFLYHFLRLAYAAKRNANNKISYIMAINWIGLFVGVLAANFFGEIIYPGRALFTFLGTFFILAVIFLHPLWRNPVTTSTYSNP